MGIFSKVMASAGASMMTGEATSADYSVFNGALEAITTFFGKTWDIITGNPLTLVFAATGLLSVGFGIFRKAKKAAR